MKKIFYLSLTAVAMCFAACSKEEIKLPDIEVAFTATKAGIDKDTQSAELTLSLTRAAATDITAVVSYTATGVAYGTGFTTTPAATGNTIAVTIPKGQTTAALTVSLVDGVLYEGTETIDFTIAAISEPVIIGAKKNLQLVFGAIVSEGNTLTLEGKSETSDYANSVFVDFSNNKQYAVDRKGWTLGFYCGNEFRVFLNPAIQMAAAATSKTDINAVTVSDTAGLPRLVPNMMASQMIALQNVDDIAGDITKTAFAEVAADEAANNVYLVAFEDNNVRPEEYYKVKITRQGGGYKVQYGKLGGGEIKTIEVSKAAGYNMACVSFETNKTLLVEPASTNWDIEWTYGTGPFTMPGGGAVVAYWMQDYVYSNNMGGVQCVKVETSAISYENFSAANLAGLAFTGDRSAIGSSWRNTMSGKGIIATVFYVVKDPAGNYYKMRFTKMGINNDGGVRGRPIVEYALVQAAE